MGFMRWRNCRGLEGDLFIVVGKEDENKNPYIFHFILKIKTTFYNI